MKKIIFSIVILFVAIPVLVNARSGCCSHHGGVCGCSCCDGSALSATCAPYYPECNSAPVAYCGDYLCNNNETCNTCPKDCGSCPAPVEYCGDGVCNNNETCLLCSKDCGSCPTPEQYCGDGTCNNDETCLSCSKDCGLCPTASVKNNSVNVNAVNNNQENLNIPKQETNTLSTESDSTVPVSYSSNPSNSDSATSTDGSEASGGVIGALFLGIVYWIYRSNKKNKINNNKETK
ncbi:MAG: hypothetical protein WC460_04820 [Patescibacteria group bacterium]